jgi:putative hydrolase of the HAD superfamily
LLKQGSQPECPAYDVLVGPQQSSVRIHGTVARDDSFLKTRGLVKMEKLGIRALIFDYGGVISQPQKLDAFQGILLKTGIDEHQFREIYYAHRRNYDNGQLSGSEYWHKILQFWGHETSESTINHLIQADVKSWTHINRTMIRFIESYRAEVEKLAIISNMVRDTLAYLQNHFAWLNIFDYQIYSCELGINKPDSRIYEYCLNSLNVPAQECLFVDDSEKNVRGALESGMQVIHYQSFPQFSQDFSKKYFLVGDPS